jgi:serine/threonine-protein kinase
LSNISENTDEKPVVHKPYSKYREAEKEPWKLKFNFNSKASLPYFLMMLIFVLGLYFIFLLFDGIIMPSIVHSRDQVKVPELSGKGLSDGLTTLKQSNLSHKVAQEIYSEDYPPNTIVKQVPYGGSVVKEGRTVYLTVSKGKEMVSVPYLVSLPLSKARIELINRGLEIGEITYDYSETIGRDSIMQQNILPSKYVPYGSMVNIVVSQGSNSQEAIPSLIGLWQEDINLILEEAGFVLGSISYQASETFTPNTVISQFPIQGETHPKGTRIDVVVSK